MADTPQIDPETGERVSSGPPVAMGAIDPSTGERVANAVAQQQPLAQMRAAPPESTQQVLADFATDLRSGGGRTALGRFLGRMQGRGDAGYTGLNSGGNAGTAEILGSPELGATQIVQGAQQIPSHPVSGALGVVKGVAQAATIPSLMVGGPGASAAINAIPSAAHAGEVLGDVAQVAQHVPVSVNAAANPLLRVQELGQTGSVMPKVARQLLSRATDPSGSPILFPEARDFYSNISRLSADEFNRLTPVMQRAVGALRAGLHSDITDAASTVGQAEPYAKAIAEYAQASRLGKTLTNAGKAALGTAVGGALYSKGKQWLGVLSGH